MAKANTAKDSNAIVEYFREVRAELNKVTWASREQAINLTLVVVAVTVVISLFLGVLDLIFGNIVEVLITAF